MPFTQEDTELYRRDVHAGGTTLTASEREALLKKYLPKPTKRNRRRSRSSSSSSSRSESYNASATLNHNPNANAGTTLQKRHKRRIRPYLKFLLYSFLHILIQFIFGIYIRFRQITNATLHKFLAIRHYHHRTPAYIERDTQSLSRLPEHLSVLLKYDPAADGDLTSVRDGNVVSVGGDSSALETLIDEVAELCAWSAAAGIPVLSVYEKSGVLKSYMSAVQELVNQKLVSYFGRGAALPKLRVCAPNLPVLEEPMRTFDTFATTLFDSDVNENGNGVTEARNGTSNGRHHPSHRHQRPRLDLLLLSISDGRDTLVDLTRTLAEMSQSSKLRPRDINSSLIDTEINATTAVPEYDEPWPHDPSSPHTSESTPPPSRSRPQSRSDGVKSNHKSDSINKKSRNAAAQASPFASSSSEPDLLIVFGSYIKLDGYPPWQVRLTEIFCVGDSGGDVSRGFGSGRTRVEYQAFLRALWSYSGAQMRFGR